MSSPIDMPPPVNYPVRDWTKRGGPIGLTDDQAARIVSAYEAGASLVDAGSIFGLSRCFVVGLFKRLCVTIRHDGEAHRQHALNERAFADAANDPTAAYVVGLLFADGCITRSSAKRAQITIGLSGDDGRHLEMVRDFLGSDHPLVHKEKGGSFERSKFSTVLRVSSAVMADDLARYGVVPRKSLTAEARGGVEASRDFWRGVVDGDGSIWLQRTGPYPNSVFPFMNLCGSLATVRQFKHFLNAHGISSYRIRSNSSVNCWRVDVGSSKAYHAINLLYDGCGIALPRKLARAREILERYKRFAEH